MYAMSTRFWHKTGYDNSKLSNHFSYVICAFIYRMVELDIVLSYIRSRVWGIIYVVGPGVVTVQTPQRPFPCNVRQWKVLDIAIDAVLGHCLCTWRPRPYELFVVPAGVTGLLEPCNPPRS
jgi:hypothetical protein